MKNSKIALCLTLLFSLLLFTQGNVGFAEEESHNGYTVTQSIIEVQDKQGGSVHKAFQVKNESEKSVKVKVQVRDFEMKDNQLIFKEDVHADWSLAKWTLIEESEFLLEGSQNKKINLDINIPENAEIGEHVALIAIQFIPENADGKSVGNVSVATEIMPVLYVTVTDPNGKVTITKDWELGEFTYRKQENGSFLFDFNVINKGNVHLESEGTILVKNRITGSSKKIKIPRVNLLPNAEKTIVTEWIPKESYGYFEIEANISMDGKKFETHETKVMIIPWIPILSGAGIIILIGFSIRLYFKRLKRRMLIEARNQIISEQEVAPGENNE
jgi:hypothetical protein